jgi:hypothetical protein
MWILYFFFRISEPLIDFILNFKVYKFMTKKFQKSREMYRESFLKVFSHEFADFEIEYKFNEWL